MKNNDMKIQDEDYLRAELKESLDKGNFSFIFNPKSGQDIGFFTWLIMKKGNLPCIYVNNMCVLKEFRNKDNLLFLRHFFREKYPHMEFTYWKNEKKDKYYYCR